MLVEHGFVRAQLPDGREWTFTPSLGRIAELGGPFGIVRLYAELHGAKAAAVAREVLAGLCDDDDTAPLIGWIDEEGAHDGAMPAADAVLIARHLMRHGVCGTSKPSDSKAEDGGRFSERFDVGEYIALARVHLGMSAADAAALSMTELQQLMAVKFPQQSKGGKSVPSRAEYDAAMQRLKERRGG